MKRQILFVAFIVLFSWSINAWAESPAAWPGPFRASRGIAVSAGDLDLRLRPRRRADRRGRGPDVALQVQRKWQPGAVLGAGFPGRRARSVASLGIAAAQQAETGPRVFG